MTVIRSAAFTIVLAAGMALAAPLDAQTSATLTVSARVIEECTIIAKSKRELVRIARQLNDPSIIRRCSKGVVSRVDKRMVKVASLRPPADDRASVVRRTVSKPPRSRGTDVLLVTVTY